MFSPAAGNFLKSPWSILRKSSVNEGGSKTYLTSPPLDGVWSYVLNIHGTYFDESAVRNVLNSHKRKTGGKAKFGSMEYSIHRRFHLTLNTLHQKVFL